MIGTLPNKKLLRPDEVADYLSLSPKTIYGWIATGRIEAQKIFGTVRIKREDIEKLIIPVINDNYK